MEVVMRKFILYMLLPAAVFGVSQLFSLQASAQDAAALDKQGKEAFLKFTPEGFEEAISLYNRAIQANPKDAVAYAGLGEVYSFMGFYRYQVKEDYEDFYNKSYSNMVKALELGPTLEQVQVALAYTYLHLSWEKEAIATSKKVLSQNPNNTEAMFVLWSASGENPDSPEIRKVIELAPNYIPAYIGLGNAFFFKKRSYGQASEYFKKAAEIAPSAQIHNLFGTVLRTQGNYNAAIDEYQKAIQLNPKYAPAYMNLGITYFYMNQLNQSIARQKEAITLNPNYPDSYFFIAQGYDRENNAQQAIMYYRKFLEMSVEQGQYAGYSATARERIAALGGGQ
jgi:superkiller protein 3